MLRRFLIFLLLFTSFMCSAQALRIKVSIDTTGIYSIDHLALRQMGFAHPEKVVVYGSGGVAPANHRFDSDYTPHVVAPCMHTASRLLFYGEGTVRASVSSPTSASIEKCYTASRASYFLAEGASVPYIAADASVANDAVPDSTHLAVQYFERDIISPGNGGAILLSNRLVAGQADRYVIDFEGIDREASAPVYIYGSYGIKNSVKTTPVVSFSDGSNVVSLRNTGVGASSSEVVVYRPGSFSASLRPARDTNSGTLAFAPPADFKGTLCAVDYVYVLSRRVNNAAGSHGSVMHLCGPGGRMAFADAPQTLKVWNVTPHTAASECPVSFDAKAAVVPYSTVDGKATLVAFDSAASFPSPVWEDVAATGTIDTTGSPQMLIISAPALMEAATELADIHRHYDGMEVMVVNAVDVYNDFSDGLRTPMAFRRLARQLYDSGNGSLKHILLYGATDLYNKRIDDSGCYLVCFEAENPDHSRQVSANYCCDQYFGMLSDSFHPDYIERERMQANVGRVPASSPAMAAEYNCKVRRYYELGVDPLYSARTFMLSGPGDDYIHYRQSDEFAALLSENKHLSIARGDSYFYYPVGRGWPDLDRTLAHDLTLGTGLLAFAGHTNPTALSNIDFNFIDEHRYNRPPLGFFASCESFAIDHPDFSIGRLMLMRPGGGVLGVIAAGRTVVLNHNRRLGVEVAKEYTRLKPGDKWGDLFRRARNNLLDENVADAVMVNTLCYNYGGDPALPFYIPSYSVVVDGNLAEFKAGEPTVLKGCVTDADGVVAEHFYGTVEVNVHCPADTLVNLVDSEPLSATDNHRLLARAAGRVEAGRFTITVTPPTIDRQGPVRVSIGATSSDGGECALGLAEGIYCRNAGNAGLYQAPVFERLEVDVDHAFSDGTCVLQADIRVGDSGINIAPVLGAGISAVLDNRIILSDIQLSFVPDGLAAMEAPFATPAVGRHSIDLTLTSNSGARARKSVQFIVERPKPVSTLRHNLGPDGVARESIEFTVEGVWGEGARLLVTDGAGNTVLSAPIDSLPYVWNLCKADGSRVADGLYRAAVMFPVTAHATPALEFVVLGAQ